MTYPLISFLLVDATNSPSKFDSAQAEIKAFFHKLPIPTQVHRVQRKSDLSNAIRRSQEGLSELPAGGRGLFAIADCPIRFPLTVLIENLTLFHQSEERPEEILSFHQRGWKDTKPEGSLESLARSLLSPPHAPIEIDSFPPLISGPLEFLMTSSNIQRLHPIWLKAGLQLEAYRLQVPRAEKTLATSTGPLLLPRGWFFNLKMWYELQRLISQFRKAEVSRF